MTRLPSRGCCLFVLAVDALFYGGLYLLARLIAEAM